MLKITFAISKQIQFFAFHIPAVGGFVLLFNMKHDIYKIFSFVNNLCRPDLRKYSVLLHSRHYMNTINFNGSRTDQMYNYRGWNRTFCVCSCLKESLNLSGKAKDDKYF